MLQRTLFRQKALEKLSSPDNIHELVEVTSSRSWLTLLALGGLTVSFVAWCFLGELPKMVSGQGILIQSGGLAEVTLLGSGIVNQILVEEGDTVRKNDTIALVAQPELQLQIENAQDKLQYLKDRRDRLVKFNLEEENLKTQFQEKYRLEDQLEEAKIAQKRLEEQLNNVEDLYRKGNYELTPLNKIRLQFGQEQRNIIILESKSQNLNVELSALNTPDVIELEAIEGEIKDLRRSIEELLVKFSLSAYVKSPYNGKVIELMTKKGQLIEVGAPVVSIEVSNQLSADLQAVVYIAPSEGKKIEPKMRVRIAPSTVKSEEFGYIEGIVQKVSEYPATRQGMMSVLGNADLVQNFAQQGLPISITIRLEKDKTESGFRWTSQKGPAMQIRAGTLCTAEIILARQSPISILLPF
jgi:HlyD family secretion protein